MSRPATRRAAVGRVVQVQTLAELDRLVADGATRMRGWRLQGIDLRDRTTELLALDPGGALVLGCRLDRPADEHLRHGGAVVFPEIPDVPVDPYRTALYTADELYAHLDEGYRATPDARAYAWSQRPGDRSADAVPTALHDAAIDTALDRLVAGRRVIGVMGGHALTRGDDAYREAARLGRALARTGALVGTGGGPGAMEAVNLGAALTGHGDEALDEAIDVLATVATYRPSIEAWAGVAFEVRRRWPGGDGGLGVPTWFYGHEPANVFASAIAKYFQNSVREATLVQRCDGGIVFLPGAAGTVQEVFQDACENFYADEPTVAPMVLVGVDHWTRRVPAWPLLTALGEGRPMARRLALVEGVDEALAALSM